MKWREHITQDPQILAGKPVLKGTRLSVEFLLERLAAGDTPEYLLQQFPTLREEHFRAAYAFAADQLSITRMVLLDREAV